MANNAVAIRCDDTRKVEVSLLTHPTKELPVLQLCRGQGLGCLVRHPLIADRSGHRHLPAERQEEDEGDQLWMHVASCVTHLQTDSLAMSEVEENE